MVEVVSFSAYFEEIDGGGGTMYAEGERGGEGIG